MSRINDSRRKSLSNSMYENFLKDRGVSEISYIPFTNFKKLSEDQKRQLTKVNHTWKSGDRYYKLSSLHFVISTTLICVVGTVSWIITSNKSMY